MTPDEKIRRANEALQLTQNPLLREAFDRIERDAIEAMLSVRDDVVDADRLHRAAADRVRTIRDVRAALASVISEGQQAGRRGPAIA